MRTIERVISSIILFFPFFFSCGPGDDGPVAGSGSKTPNSPSSGIIKGVVIPYVIIVGDTIIDTLSDTLSIDTTVLKNIQVTQYIITVKGVADYYWIVNGTTFPDKAGNFQFDSVDAGYYSIVFKDEYNNMAFSGYFECSGYDGLLFSNPIKINKPQTAQGILDKKTNVLCDYLTLGLVGTPYTGTMAAADSVFQLSQIPIGGGSESMLSSIKARSVRLCGQTRE